MIRLKRLIVLVLPLLLCANLATTSRAQAPANPNQRTVEVSGHGDANAKPDAMIVSFAVDNQAPTADECTKAHAEKVRKIIDALKGKLGADTKIETSEYSLNPNITYVNAPASQPQPPKETWRFIADLTANSDSLEMMGALVDSAMAAGATRLQQSGINEIPEGAVAGGDARGVRMSDLREGMPPKMKQVAFVTVEVEALGTTATDATRAGSPRVAQVQKVLKQQVGDHGTVELSQFNIVQVDPNQPRLPVQTPPQPPQQQVQNFAAHTTVTAETSKLDLLGPVVQAGIDNGATRLNQVQFTLRNDGQARKDAIEKASEEAKMKAESVAKSMGVALGKILHISTNAQVRPQVIYGNSFQTSVMGARAMSHASIEAPSVPVLPHEVGFSADVTVAYEIQ